MFNSLHITSTNRSCLLIVNVCWTLVASNILCAMSNYGCCCISTSITYINLLIAISIWDHNKLCNKQQMVKTSSTNETCNLVVVRNPFKFFFENAKNIFQNKATLFVLSIIQQFHSCMLSFFFKRNHNPSDEWITFVT